VPALKGLASSFLVHTCPEIEPLERVGDRVEGSHSPVQAEDIRMGVEHIHFAVDNIRVEHIRFVVDTTLVEVEDMCDRIQAQVKDVGVHIEGTRTVMGGIRIVSGGIRLVVEDTSTVRKGTRFDGEDIQNAARSMPVEGKNIRRKMTGILVEVSTEIVMRTFFLLFRGRLGVRSCEFLAHSPQCSDAQILFMLT
jgi:hypothetical protein